MFQEYRDFFPLFFKYRHWILFNSWQLKLYLALVEVVALLVTQLCLTLCDPTAVAHQAPLSMKFSSCVFNNYMLNKRIDVLYSFLILFHFYYVLAHAKVLLCKCY